MPRMIRGGGIFEENDGGDMLQDSERSEICDVRIPSVSCADSIPTPFGPTGHFPLTGGGIDPLCPRGAFVGADAYIGPRRKRRFYGNLRRIRYIFWADRVVGPYK